MIQHVLCLRGTVGKQGLANLNVRLPVFSPADPSLYLLASDDGVFRSDNKGVTWLEPNPSFDTGYSVVALDADPFDADTILTSLSGSKGVNRVVGHERIQLFLNSQVTRHSGSVGDFRVAIATRLSNGTQRETAVQHSVLIATTGGVEAESAQYLYGQDPRIVRQSALEETARPPPRSSPAHALGGHDPVRHAGWQAGVLLAHLLHQTPSRTPCA